MALYDTHIQILDPSLQRSGSIFVFGFSKPLFITGIQKLANRWLKLFFTPKNSHPFRRTEGTDFPFLIGSNIDDINSLQAVISEYIDDANDQIKAVDKKSPWLTEDERLKNVSIVKFNIVNPTSIEFWVELINANNTRLKILIPYAMGEN